MNTAVDYIKLTPQPVCPNSKSKTTITSSLSASLFLRDYFKMDIEEFWIIALTSGKQVIHTEMLFRGTVDSCLVHPRDIFRFACINNASSILVSHNHPSGDIAPSENDRTITKRLVKIGQWLQIPVIDHLILTAEDYYSFADNGLMKSGGAA